MESVETIVDALDAKGLIRKNKIVGKYYSVCCPYHSNGNEAHPSSGILLEDEWKGGRKTPKGWFHCFTCRKVATIQQLVDDVISLHKIPVVEANQLREMVELDQAELESVISPQEFKDFETQFTVDKIAMQLNMKQPTFVSEDELAKYRFTVKYMYDRGLTDEIIERYDIGFDAHFVPYGGKKEVPCITFPVKNINGDVLFIARRSIEGKRFYLPEGIEKPVYGVYELTSRKSVTICESIFNALSFVRIGQPAIALLGTGNSKQITDIKRYVGAWEYGICLDPDEAGLAGTRRLKKGLSSSAFVFEYKGIPEGKDANDLTDAELRNLERE